MTHWAGRKNSCRLGSKKVWVGALEVDHLLAVGDRLGALGIGDAAAELVDQIDADEDADLAPEVAPTLGQLGGDAGECARHGTANCNPAVKRPLGSSCGLETTGQAPRAGDPRPAAGDVRDAGERAARAPDRRADQDGALPAHQRPQPRPRLRRPARALPHLGGGPRRAGRRGRGGDPARRPRQAEGAADPGDPRAARRASRPRLDRDGAARGVARVPARRCRGSAEKPRPAC